jgi:type 1 glutamine amidotransferase
MLGAACKGCGPERQSALIPLDKHFPGMEHFLPEFAPREEWYAFTRLAPDLHLILARERGPEGGSTTSGPEPVAWARMEGKGRVYYTSLGHAEETWQNPVFRQMLLGALRWVTCATDARIAPNAAR